MADNKKGQKPTRAELDNAVGSINTKIAEAQAQFDDPTLSQADHHSAWQKLHMLEKMAAQYVPLIAAAGPSKQEIEAKQADDQKQAVEAKGAKLVADLVAALTK